MIRFAAIIIAAAVAASPVLAQEANIFVGRAYAEQLCGDCHAVTPDQKSPDPNAPGFRKVANIPGMTTIAFSAWMYSMHPSMPNIVLTPDQGEHIFAYILSLKNSEERPK